MSSPNPFMLFSSRCFSIGTSGLVSIDRKKMRRRAVSFPSRCSAANASYMRNGSALASVSAANDSWMSGRPGITNAPMSTLVVTPTLTRVGLGIERPALLIVERLHRAQRVERGKRRRVGGNRAGVAHRHALAGEERLAARVRRRRAGERQEHDDGMVRRGGVELGQRRQALLRELRRVPPAHRGDELAGRHGLRARLQRGLHVGDGRRGFEPRVVTRPDAEQDDVVVVVDQAGNGGPAAQVDRLRARAQPAAALADGDERAVLDRHFRDDRVARVHGDDLAVHQPEIARAGAAILGGRGRAHASGPSPRRGDDEAMGSDSRCHGNSTYFNGFSSGFAPAGSG